MLTLVYSKKRGPLKRVSPTRLSGEVERPTEAGAKVNTVPNTVVNPKTVETFSLDQYIRAEGNKWKNAPRLPCMIPEDVKNEVEELVKELNYHGFLYYVQDAPVLPDSEYDRLYRRLKELEEQYGYVLPDSPTQRVGAPAAERFGKITHAQPMLSLDNAFSKDELGGIRQEGQGGSSGRRGR